MAEADCGGADTGRKEEQAGIVEGREKERLANQTFLLLLFCFPSNRRRRRSAIGSGRSSPPSVLEKRRREGGNESRPKSGLCKHLIALSVCCGPDFQIERKRAGLEIAAVILDYTPRVWELLRTILLKTSN